MAKRLTIWMSFGVVSGVGRGVGVLDDPRMEVVEGERGSFEGKCGASHCNQWALSAIRGGDAALPKLL